MTSIKKEKKVEKKEEFLTKKIEIALAIIFGIISIILIVLAFNNDIFIPASTSITALDLFLISYYFRNDKNKKVLVYILMTIVFILLIFTVGYTIIRTA